MNKVEHFHCQDLHLKQKNNINLIDTMEEKNNPSFLTTCKQNFAEAKKKKKKLPFKKSDFLHGCT